MSTATLTSVHEVHAGFANAARGYIATMDRAQFHADLAEVAASMDDATLRAMHRYPSALPAERDAIATEHARRVNPEPNDLSVTGPSGGEERVRVSRKWGMVVLGGTRTLTTMTAEQALEVARALQEHAQALIDLTPTQKEPPMPTKPLSAAEEAAHARAVDQKVRDLRAENDKAVLNRPLNVPHRVEVFVPGDGWTYGGDEYKTLASAKAAAEHIASSTGREVRVLDQHGTIVE